MKLFTKANLKSLPTLDESAQLSIADQKVWVKLFGGSATWYITSLDPETNEAFGFVNLGDAQCAELGYIDMNKLTRLKIPPFGLPIERDRHFDPMPLQEVMDTVKAGGHV